MQRGTQTRIPTPGQSKRQHVIGADNGCDHTVPWHRDQRKASEAFTRFLETRLVKHYPQDAVVRVMDNGSIHKSAAVQAALSLFEHRLQVVWPPPYCSTLNPIERFWRHLKNPVCLNQLFPCLEELVAAVEQALTGQNDPLNPHRFACLTAIV